MRRHFSVYAAAMLLLACDSGPGTSTDTSTSGDTDTSSDTDAVAGFSVLEARPVDGATGVAVDGFIEADFSDFIDRTTATATSFTLMGPDGAVEGTVTAGASSAKFTPTAPLAFNATYTATLGTAIQLDMDRGAALSTDYVWSFTTVAAFALVQSAPASGTTGMRVEQALVLEFNAPVDPASLSPGSVYASYDRLFTSAKSVELDYLVDGTTLTITPKRGRWHEYESLHTVTLSENLTSMTGNALTFQTVTFTTVLTDPDYWYAIHGDRGGPQLALDVDGTRGLMIASSPVVDQRRLELVPADQGWFTLHSKQQGRTQHVRVKGGVGSGIQMVSDTPGPSGKFAFEHFGERFDGDTTEDHSHLFQIHFEQGGTSLQLGLTFENPSYVSYVMTAADTENQSWFLSNVGKKQ